MLLVLPVLGLDAFESAKEIAAKRPIADTPKLFLEGPDANGTGQEKPEGFLVFAGSTARCVVHPGVGIRPAQGAG